MTTRSAQSLASVAMRLRSLPVCARAYADGTLSGGQIEAIVARLDDELAEVFAAQESELVPYLIPLSVAGVSGPWLPGWSGPVLKGPSLTIPSSRCTCREPWMTGGFSTAR